MGSYMEMLEARVLGGNLYLHQRFTQCSKWITSCILFRSCCNILHPSMFETFSQAIESSPMVFSGVPLSRPLVLCVEFLDHRLSFCYFSFVICIGCPSLIYGFRLSIWYLQTFFLYKHDLSWGQYPASFKLATPLSLWSPN